MTSPLKNEPETSYPNRMGRPQDTLRRKLPIYRLYPFTPKPGYTAEPPVQYTTISVLIKQGPPPFGMTHFWNCFDCKA